MKKFYGVLKKGKLFFNFSNNELDFILKCLNAEIFYYEKNQNIILIGDELKNVGIVLKGKSVIQKEDINGNIILIEELHPSNIFAEAFVCAGINNSPVSVWATTESIIMFLDYKKIIRTCHFNCEFHGKLIQNMLQTMSKKLIYLNQKINIIQKITIREKLQAFFQIEIEKNNSNEFEISLSRLELADYIGSNRSAMSRELSNMQKEDLINYKGNKFFIKNKVR